MTWPGCQSCTYKLNAQHLRLSQTEYGNELLEKIRIIIAGPRTKLMFYLSNFLIRPQFLVIVFSC